MTKQRSSKIFAVQKWRPTVKWAGEIKQFRLMTKKEKGPQKFFVVNWVLMGLRLQHCIHSGVVSTSE